jgi:hypothetical protein
MVKVGRHCRRAGGTDEEAPRAGTRTGNLHLARFAGCTFVPFSLIGTWSMTTSYGTETLTFDNQMKRFTLWAVGTVNGTWECSIVAVDRGESHIRVTQIDSTGDLAGDFYTDGQTVYLTYDITQNELTVDFSSTDYPTSTYNRPYFKD